MTGFMHGSSFVVACPACGGWIAVTAGMAGTAACCPLCAAAFQVPAPSAAVPSPAHVAVPEPAAPVVAASTPRHEASASTTPPPGMATSTVGEPVEAKVSPPIAPAIGRQPPPPAASEPPSTFDIPEDVLAATGHGVEPGAGLQFHEPAAKIVGHGANAIELRRLTPEEKDARRRRRNVLVLLTGAAILIAITLLLGNGGRRRKAR